MATVTKGYTFGATEQVTATKLHNLVDLATVGSLSLADFGDNFLGSMPTTAGQMRYFNLIQSLPSGNYVYYNGSNNFIGKAVELSDLGNNFLSSLPTTAGQIRYFNIIPSLASGAYVRYTGTNNFIGSALEIPLASVPSSSGNQYWSPRFLATLTVNWDNGNVQYLTLASGSQSVTMNNPKDGGRYALILKQPSGGYGNLSMPTIVLWPSATYSILTTTASKVDIVTLLYDSANSRYYAASSLNY